MWLLLQVLLWLLLWLLLRLLLRMLQLWQRGMWRIISSRGRLLPLLLLLPLQWLPRRRCL